MARRELQSGLSVAGRRLERARRERRARERQRGRPIAARRLGRWEASPR